MKKKIIVGYLIGMILGCVFANVCGVQKCNQWGIYNGEYIKLLKGAVINYNDLFAYVWKSRMLEYLLLMLCMFVPIGKQLFLCYITYMGFSLSMIASVMVMNLGFSGVGAYVVSLFPHYIMYILALYVMYEMINEKHQKAKSVIPYFVLVVLFVGIGVVFESYLNTFLVKKIVINL